MLRLLIYIKHRFHFLFAIADYLNALLFTLLWKKKVANSIRQVLSKESADDNTFRLIKEQDLKKLELFFKRQPSESFIYFKPHAFDLHTLKQQYRNNAFIMFGMFDNQGDIIAYSFLRCLINKRAFRGKIVDMDHQGKGYAKKMCFLLTMICQQCGFRLFATISRDNIQSIASSQAVNRIHPVRNLSDNYVYVEYLRRT